MALGADRRARSAATGVTATSAAAKVNAGRSSASVLNDIDDLYENNAFDDDRGNDDDGNMRGIGASTNVRKSGGSSGNNALARKPLSRNQSNDSGAAGSNSKAKTTSDNNNNNDNTTISKPAANTKQLDFNVWVARKDKYERIATALAALNTERAANDEQWFDVAVSLAATDCVLKTGKTDKCDCAGVCRDASHSVTKQRTRCQCPAKKCSLCKRCVNTTPGAVTDKMVAALSPYRLEPTQSMLALAELIVQAGDGQSLHASGKPKITTAIVRVAQTVLSQCSILTNDDGVRVQRPCTCPVRSLGDLWVQWTTRYHTFSRTRLTEREAATFSSGTRQMMEIEEDAATDTKTFYMTLKWHQAAKPQKGDTAKIAARRMLTPDQKRQNAFFLGLCKKYWLQAQHAVVEHLQTKMTHYDALPSDKRKKLPRSDAMELAILNRLGTRRILQWLESDRDAIQEKRDDELREKTEGGVVAHNAWVKRKDRLRIRMPSTDSTEVKKPGSGTWKPPRFDFSSGKGVVRQQNVHVPSSSVEILRDSGLKYVHAMSEGFQGRGGDLEKSKQLLVKKGHILRANFDAGAGGGQDADDNDAPFSKDRYMFEKAHNPALQKKRFDVKKRHATSKVRYDAWLVHKAMRDKALKFLTHIPAPSLAISEAGETNDADNDAEDAIPASVRWEEVGKALKAVDRTLLTAWIEWTNGFRSAARCRVLWDSFAPIACDVHCTSSAIRDVFLKLLHRKGIDYKQAFVDLADRKHKQLLARGDNVDEDLPDELTDAELLERYATLTTKEFTRLLVAVGIVLQPEEVQRVVEYFDTNNDNVVSMQEFFDVVGETRNAQCHGDTDELLKHVCMWETVCHECGMLHAFQLVVGSGSRRLRSELPGHIKRREASARFDCDPECDMREVKTKAPAQCAYSQWTDETAAPFLKKLELWSAEQREQRVLQQLVTEGSPPAAPTLFRDDDDALDPTTQLLLRWHAPIVSGNNGAAFYILETIGAEGTASFRLNDYKEVCRDPKDFSDNHGEPRYHFVVSNLTPNTKYGFRVRALNGFGAGAYTFGYFFTAPSVPPTPLAVRVSANSIHLQWETTSYYRKQLRELRKVFDDADVDANGVVSRDELIEEIERRKPRLLAFLQKTTVATGASSGGAPLSVFDAIETDDNECISWDEFVRFFHGFFEKEEDEEATKGTTTTTLRASHSTRSLRSSSSTRSVGSKSRKTNAAASTGVTQCRYILKQCVNEAAGEYVEIYRGTTPSFVVHGLASGSTFQFRVQAYNEEHMCSLHSEPVVVNTLLQTPAPPNVVDTALTATSVKLRWVAANARPCLSHEALQARSKQSQRTSGGGPSQDDEITRILKEWAQETSLDDGCVDFQAKFDQYDVDKSGYIELPEFKTLLEELGVPATPERLAAYMEAFDTDHDGRISFQEFTRWWNRTDVHYVLKRDCGRALNDNEITGTTTGLLSHANTTTQMSVVSYRGKDPVAVVHGLEPNRLYTFRLRVVSSHASSQLSDSLEVWTTPRAPTSAGIVYTLATLAQLCWYAGAGSAHRFIVECKFVETLASSESGYSMRRTGTIPTATARATPSSRDWTKVYDGSESIATITDLVPNTVYRLRVLALNCVGGVSDQSTVTQFCTLSRDEERATSAVLRPANAADHFTVECCEPGDVVVGDTILFSERICRSESGKIVGEDSPLASRNALGGGGGGYATGRSGSGAVTLQTSSVYSVTSATGGADAIGERTVAARVVNVKRHERYGNVVTMVVVWCTLQLYEDVAALARGSSRPRSAAAAKAFANKTLRTSGSIHSTSHNVTLANPGYTLASDLKISRKEKSLYRYDTFRKEWQDERARHASTWE